MTMRADKKDVYLYIKLSGMAVMIPLALASGPYAGFVCAQLLQQRWHTGQTVSIACILIGFFAGVFEAVRILRSIIKATGKDTF